MEKESQMSNKIEVQPLQKFIKLAFSEYHPPSLKEFLKIRVPNEGFDIKAKSIILQPHSQLSEQITSILESQSIYYIHTGSLELHRKQGRRWRRDIQYKQGAFFTLLNYKNMGSLQPQWFKLVLKTKVNLSVLPINPKYSYEWMKNIWMKTLILSKVFLYNDPQIDEQKKKYKFNDFISNFKHQIFRRDTKIINESKKNQKIFIIGKGQAKIYKQLRPQAPRSDVQRNVQILYLREGAIFGGELFLISSKAIHTIISNHFSETQRSGSHLSVRQQEQQNENENEVEGQKKIKKRRKSRLSRISVESGGYELYNPHENMSNFTVVAESANLELYYIEIDRLVQIISERYKINFLQFYQSTYITLLRRNHEKMMVQLRKQQVRMSQSQSRIYMIAAKAFSSLENQSQTNTIDKQGIGVKMSQIKTMNPNLQKLKNQQVRKVQNNQLQKRTQLIVKQKKPSVDYRSKIASLIEQKLIQSGNQENGGQIAQDLAQIFMKNNEGRSEDIQRRYQILQKKSTLLQKRGGWKAGWNMLSSQGIKVNAKKPKEKEDQNYLQGLEIESYTDNIRNTCSHKIQKTNRIKQQFMKIKSECPSCNCYENFEHFSKQSRRTMSCFGRTGYKTAQGWGKTSGPAIEQESLETVYNRMTFLSQKTKEKYNHNIHLLKVRQNRTQLSRRKSTPKFY